MNKPQILNIAHRGARSIAPENTILAAQKAFEIGADLWELDVAMTADGEIVVLHDDTLERTSDAAHYYPDRKPWKVETFTLEEIRRLDFGSWYIETDPFNQIASGVVTKEDQQVFGDLPIPTLREALLFTQDNKWLVNIEIKDLTGKPGDKFVVEKVVELVQRTGMTSSVIISSFNHSYLQRVRTAISEIRTAALVVFPDPDPIKLLKRLDAQAYNPGLETLDYDQIPQVVGNGYNVYIWTVNDEVDMKKLISNGVSGIFTDFPQRLKSILESNCSAIA
ncbi:MAG TPA: glycerophosphodiester phosphodiesterase family protein [Anaerolineaceae bacterium]|nr:glycerophosphodiester phosphodiesterase family protein [Anaerolineaceae bacterium]